jgi:nucleoside-specific outer membrane channel protein Tsx
METIMKKIILALAAVAALSSAALAERSSETGDRSDYVQTQTNDYTGGGAALQSLGSSNDWLSGDYGVTRDPAELRRWDEKNN